MDNAKITSSPGSGKVLLLVGSPKGLKSTSRALGTYLLRKLEAGGMATESMLVGAALHGQANMARMLEAVDSADLVIVSFPLYVDQLPAPLVRAGKLNQRPQPVQLNSVGPLGYKKRGAISSNRGEPPWLSGILWPADFGPPSRFS